MDEYEYQGQTPDLTAGLTEGTGVTRMRGLAQIEIRPVSTALVIGLGGSGVQSVSRVKSAVDGARLEQKALEAVSFVGIDAVDESKMNPPLPPGVSLGPALVNLQGFNARSFLDGQLPNDNFLKQWWDDKYNVPSGTLNEGLRRERMLGRLCFHKDSQLIRSRIASAMSKAAEIRHEYVAQGNAAGAHGEIPVYLVASCAGGTGSAGFLEVVMLVHEAARQLNLVPRIRAFIVLPSVFEKEVLEQQGGQVAMQAQKANAYGFFKELDHFLVRSSELPAALGLPAIGINDGDLIHQVYVFDANLGSSGKINSPSDIFDIIAEAIYNFLFSEMGRAVIGVNGVNIERELSSVDSFGKPRRYCSIGLARVVFPGDTIRFHFVMWWCDWMIREGFLRGPSQQELADIRESDVVLRLQETIASLVNEAIDGRFDDAVYSFIDIGRDAPNTLEAQRTVAAAQETFGALQTQASSVANDIRSSLASARPRLVERLKAALEATAFESGDGVKVAREIVKVAEKTLRNEVATATDMLNAQVAMLETSFADVEDRIEVLEDAEGLSLLGKVGAAVVGKFKDDVKTPKDAAEEVGAAIKDWTRAVVDGELAQARLEFVKRALTACEILAIELTRTEERLVQISEATKSGWEADDLLGKDAGPRATTVLIPRDSQPEVEWSRISKSTRKDVRTEHEGRLRGELMADFQRRWMIDGATRGFFDLGSDEPGVAKRAKTSLLYALERDAKSFAWRTQDDEGESVNRLPSDLPDAAHTFDETKNLETGILGIEQLSRNVCWTWERGRFHMDQAPDQERQVDLMPQVTTGVAYHASSATIVEPRFPDAASRAAFPDPERIVALSCEWAVPIHCLPIVDEWKREYDSLAGRRRQQRQKNSLDIEPPNHVDKRFESLPDLVPQYFKHEEAAPRFAQALLVHEALLDSKTVEAVAMLYVRDATLPPVSPVRLLRGTGYVARFIQLEEGELRPAPESTDRVVGASVYEAVRALGLDTALSNVIDVVWAQLIREVDAESLIDILDRKVVPRVDAGIKKRRSSQQEKTAYRHLQNAIDDIRDQLLV